MGAFQNSVRVLKCKFDNEDFEIKLDEIISKYDFYVKKIESYPFSSNLMSEEYERLFLDLINKDFNNDFHLELEYLIENKMFLC